MTITHTPEWLIEKWKVKLAEAGYYFDGKETNVSIESRYQYFQNNDHYSEREERENREQDQYEQYLWDNR